MPDLSGDTIEELGRLAFETHRSLSIGNLPGEYIRGDLAATWTELCLNWPNEAEVWRQVGIALYKRSISLSTLFPMFGWMPRLPSLQEEFGKRTVWELLMAEEDL